MAMIVIEGFESGSNDVIDFIYQPSTPSVVATNTRGRWSRYSCLINTSSGAVTPGIGIRFPATKSEFYFSMGYFFPPSWDANDELLAFEDDLGNTECSIWAANTGVLHAYRGNGTTLLESSSLTLSGNQWHLIEGYILIADSGGRMQIKVDGVNFLNFTGDTKQGSSANIARLGILGLGTNQDCYVDDVIVNDTSGSVNNSFPGDLAVYPLYAADTGDQTQLNPSSTTAQRWYFSSVLHDDTSPPFDTGWERQDLASRYKLEPLKSASAALSTPGTNMVNEPGPDILFAQFISPPIAAQTLSPGGAWTVKGQLLAMELSAADNVRAQIRIRVVSQDGLTNRGTLLDFDGAALSSEFATTFTNRKFPLAASSPAALTQVVASAGDRIVVEIGGRTHNNIATQAPRVKIGGDSGTDLPENETQTSDAAPWIEFSTAITLLAENWPLVRGTLMDEDGTYVAETTLNDRDLYIMDDLDAPWTDVYGVAIKWRAREVEAGGAKIAPALKRSTTEVAGADQQLGNSYDWYTEVFDKDPTDVTNWSRTKVNDLQAGVKIR